MSTLPRTDGDAMLAFHKLVAETEATETERIAVAMMLGVRYGQTRCEFSDVPTAFSHTLQSVRDDLEKVDKP